MLRILSAVLTVGVLPALVAGSASAATTTCSTVAACVMGTNSSSGPGVAGSSKSGFGLSGISTSGHGVNGTSSSSFGVVGITTENATSAGTARAGVLGEDLSTNGKTYNSGVAGSSNYGDGVMGSTSTGVGVYGVAKTGGAGVVGVASTTGVGGDFQAGSSADGAFAVIAQANNGTGIFASSTADGPAANFMVSNSDQDILIGGDSGKYVLSVDGSGNEVIAGTLTTNGTAVVSTISATGTNVASFGARTAAPSLEDVGKAELRDGAAYVPLDSTFASTIDPRVAYSVFITAEGDSNSLYTTHLSSSGFVVRESKGGRSTLTFDYRIVAKPLDARAMHLPSISPFLHRLAQHVAVPVFHR